MADTCTGGIITIIDQYTINDVKWFVSASYRVTTTDTDVISGTRQTTTFSHVHTRDSTTQQIIE